MKTSPREEDTSATAYRVTHQVYETREVETLYVDETTGERKKTSKLMLVEKTAPGWCAKTGRPFGKVTSR